MVTDAPWIASVPSLMVNDISWVCTVTSVLEELSSSLATGSVEW